MGFDHGSKVILELEGGVADVGDGKGLTRWGQTPGWLSFWNLPIPTNAEEARENYKEWWIRSGLGPALRADDGLSLVVAVWAIHSGETVAIRGLQRALGVLEDGIIGPITIEAIRDCHRSKTARHVLISYTWFLAELGSKMFRRGWRNRLYRLSQEM